ncbi:ABC transporter ATP-binding protein [Roseinatronobacter alkalisoli]|uniref:ABC transporter ATP-binding protein n=1 Tax=Roseinatronobacter alkalisoli TaxID=3028235 RepID=A0ABT5TC65_9RHOB|nr:ABC transporter ATP-binding protein [Roseinatronobacter sp. HJB301]MDD7972717.1 ABC transporter ATP-binding protein [Roseinatronobacter sp. HJB301]
MTLIPPAHLELEQISVRVGGGALVHDVSLQVRPGEFVGLLGPNGAGKSTLLRTIYRARRPDIGRVLLDGSDLWAQSPRWGAQRIGAVLQDMPADFPLTVRDVIAMGRAPHQSAHAAESAHDRAQIAAALQLLNLWPFAGRLFATLSGGERQRVLLGRALVQQPRLLVLDEPTNHLDLRHQMAFLTLVRQIGVSVIAALHDLTLAAMVCDRLALLDAGRVVAQGRPEDVLTPARIRQVYGVETLIQRHPTRGTLVVLPA